MKCIVEVVYLNQVFAESQSRTNLPLAMEEAREAIEELGVHAIVDASWSELIYEVKLEAACYRQLTLLDPTEWEMKKLITFTWLTMDLAPVFFFDDFAERIVSRLEPWIHAARNSPLNPKVAYAIMAGAADLNQARRFAATYKVSDLLQYICRKK